VFFQGHQSFEIAMTCVLEKSVAPQSQKLMCCPCVSWLCSSDNMVLRDFLSSTQLCSSDVASITIWTFVLKAAFEKLDFGQIRI